uniref:Uncharacterized protein n=1 Tax=Anopheles funestus TaxID=62324 RepID=A0A182RV05_ANOFN
MTESIKYYYRIAVRESYATDLPTPI